MEQGINNFIKTKKKKKKIKKMIMFILFFLLLLFLFFAKAPIFNIKVVQYKNNKIIDDEELYKLYNPIGQNMIFINTKKAETNIKENPYVESISFEKHYPNELTVKIIEKNACYYVKEKSDYYILADDLSILEVKNKISGLKLIEMQNIKIDNRNVGQKITSKTSVVESASKLAELLGRNTSKVSFSKADVSTRNNLILYHNDVKILLGSDEEFEKKVNRAINILNDSKVNLKKGYINVQSTDRVVVMDEEHPAEEHDDKKQKETIDSIVNGQENKEAYGD
ncbi:cell division protein FtsQ/DivIB [Inconstantimicrobium porci]|uniref:cell division protein FtsQ/DivIB n=1 Tax=Inconstantimicrobium porci TaxID=2652291 RepID=UPI00240A694D|nr:FtsQ-type POTRA domain-containing protein [Inconstantimicrobium porci]MDD6771916.1 FtsQ-type POTRA domain-containing protein [Inconstantimicrobium porci]